MPVPGLKTRFLVCPARSLVTVATELSQLSILPNKEQKVLIDFRLRVSQTCLFECRAAINTTLNTRRTLNVLVM